jgi:hypothetical protein
MSEKLPVLISISHGGMEIPKELEEKTPLNTADLYLDTIAFPTVVAETKPKRLFENCLFYPISALSEEFNPQNTRCIPPVKFFFRLELEQTKQFSNSL